MVQTIGEVLASAFGVAISPVPIIATILMLMSARARAASTGFLVGWVAGVALAVTVFALVGQALPGGRDGGGDTVVGVIRITLGVLLLVLAVRRWVRRPRGDEEPQLPAWMAGVDRMGAGRALPLAAALAAVNPKNLALAASAGISVGQAPDAASAVVAGVVFVVIASSTIAVPVVAALVAGERLRPALDGMRAWLTANNATIMTVLLAVLGVSALGKGLAAL